MPLLFLNERSCGTGCAPALADRAMTELARAVLAAVRADRAGTVLVSKDPITGLQIAEGYPIGKWHGNPRNRDAWRRMLQMQSKAPFKMAFPDGADFLDVEYRHRGETVEGLGAAHLLEGLGVSLPVEPRWDAARLLLEREQLVEDESGESGFAISQVDIRHASSEAHVDEHLSWIGDQLRALRKDGLDEVRTGAELWKRRTAFFPRLQFLPRVEHDLGGLSADWIRSVCLRLAELDDTVTTWDPAAHPIAPKWRSYVRQEFESRRRLCWFTDLDGVDRLFDWHADIYFKKGRLHFRLVPEERTLRVAYVGGKRGV
ncbi:hypothetical protein [Streptomyces litchfieldiae]|uniref:Uncharacterized protein n=1 Tax=Streptomyces litchfieldiae TaxID=3075543 RepID=A0ABU2MY52_9ACTN|nr:hypothetical protein [Streptomyces sp. DSM 44938]MDT0346580.1 hypothetical protein [Streptomyces sp. DSM 44938]